MSKKLYWRYKKDGKWTWKPYVSSEDPWPPGVGVRQIVVDESVSITDFATMNRGEEE
jgi:hypothetical protein